MLYSFQLFFPKFQNVLQTELSAKIAKKVQVSKYNFNNVTLLRLKKVLK